MRHVNSHSDCSVLWIKYGTALVVIPIMLAINLALPVQAFAFGVYAGYWCDGGGCYKDTGPSLPTGGNSFFLKRYPKSTPTPDSPKDIYTPGPTKADRIGMRQTSQRIRRLMKNLKKPLHANVQGRATYVSTAGSTPIFGFRDRSLSGFNPESFTPGTASAMLAVQRTAAILALADSTSESAEDSVFFGAQAAAALAGQPVRVNFTEVEHAVSMKRADVQNMSSLVVQLTERSERLRQASARRMIVESELLLEMKSISKSLPRRCFAEGMCNSSQSAERKQKLDGMYVKYRQLLSQEITAANSRDALAGKLAGMIKDKVSFTITITRQ